MPGGASGSNQGAYEIVGLNVMSQPLPNWDHHGGGGGGVVAGGAAGAAAAILGAGWRGQWPDARRGGGDDATTRSSTGGHQRDEHQHCALGLCLKIYIYKSLKYK